MLTLPALTALVNDEGRKATAEVVKRRQLYYGMSLHIDGACPAWASLRDNARDWLIPGNLIYREPLLGWFGWEYHEIFDLVLFARHPKEPEATRQWRFSQYRPFTKDGFQRAISMITGAIFQDSGYSITLSDKDDNDYIWGDNFEGKSLPGFVSGHFKSIAEDANGLFLVIPKEPANNTTTPRVEPDIWFIYSKELLHITRDEIVFKRDGYIWAVNKFGYFRWEKRDKATEWTLVEPEGYYPHMLEYIPAFVAGGIWNAQGFYDSWLIAAKAVADEFVAIKSAEQMVAKEASHPWIVEASEDCPECENGQVQWCLTCRSSAKSCDCGENAKWDLNNCRKCGGSGIVSHNPGERFIVPYEQMQKPLVQVVNAPVDINKLHIENVKTAEEKILKALHLFVIDQAQSGTAKSMDLQTRHQFVMSIANDLFDRLIPKLIEAISALRNISVFKGTIRPTAVTYQIVKPTQFQIKTSYDLLEEMKMGKDSGIPSYHYGKLLESYTDKAFGGDDVLKRKTEIINQMDKLANKPVAEVSVILTMGGATNRDYQFSTVLPNIIDRITRERGSEWLLKQSYDVINAEVQAIFSADYPEIPTIQPYTEERVNV